MINKQQVNEIVKFWTKRTGRAAPKKISLDTLGLDSGIFCLGKIKLHSGWATVETVFHELTHLEQWQDGRLLRVKDLPYEEQPAEIEAWEKAEEWISLWEESKTI